MERSIVMEMQTTDNKNLPKRSRYYQGQMDRAALKTGEDFARLPQSIVIFICTFDPFGRERYRYTFVETCREDGELLEDGTCKIFLNTKGKIETGIGRELVRFLEVDR
ncbi:MAG: PD-(D/E)XK nuclease family transposase [Pilosibacter sp.]